ncbi:hypothetical protein J6590_095885 [Homalodisca vitripennis]|nr:hypothetical protein J6590_095885 [Homalodisca vitripennis]
MPMKSITMTIMVCKLLSESFCDVHTRVKAMAGESKVSCRLPRLAVCVVVVAAVADQMMCVSASQSSTMSSVSQQSSRRPEDAAQAQRASFGRQGSTTGSVTGEDTEDTMKNLRKTFAGIFGDM